jgi:hypothetical protein
LIVQAHREYIAELAIKATVLRACKPPSPLAMSVTGVWLEWVWKAIVEATCMAVGEAKR